MRKSDAALAALATGVALFLGSFADAAWLRRDAERRQAQTAALVQRLQLTDLCLFTEARYTRHLSQADLHTAFQDHPMALDHFPSGSLVGPSAILRRASALADGETHGSVD
jgi:hypothetical protein